MRGNRPEDEARSGPGEEKTVTQRTPGSAKGARKARRGSGFKPFPLSLLTNHADFSRRTIVRAENSTRVPLPPPR